MHSALENGHAEVAQLLIESGADPVARDKYLMARLRSSLGNGEIQRVQSDPSHSAAQTNTWRLRDIWRRTKDIWISSASSSSHDPHGPSPRAPQM